MNGAAGAVSGSEIGAKPVRRASDAMRHVHGGTSRTIAFRRDGTNYCWIGEQEIHQGSKWHHAVDGTFRESIVIEYQTEPVNGIPTNRLSIHYTGSDPALLGRDFTLAEAREVLEGWRSQPVEPRPASEGYDDFDPGFLFFVLVMLCLALILCLLAVALALVCFGVAAVLLAMGIFSMSVIVGLLNRSAAAGFRAAVLQVGAVLGLLAGAGAVLVGAWITGSSLASPLRWIAGCVGGLVLGTLLAWLCNRLLALLARALSRKYRRALSSEPQPDAG